MNISEAPAAEKTVKSTNADKSMIRDSQPTSEDTSEVSIKIFDEPETTKPATIIMNT